MIRGVNVCGIVFILLFGLTIQGQSQHSKQDKLVDIISWLETERNLFFSYDPEIISGFSVTPPSARENTNSYLRELEDQLPFNFELAEGKYVILKPSKVNLPIQIVDGDTDESLPGVYLKLNDNYIKKVTDPSGKIDLSFKWKKEDTLTLTSVSYKDYKISVKDILQNKMRSISLTKETTFLPNIVVKSYMSEGIDAIQKNHSLEINTRQLGLLPGDNNKDILTSLRTLPGIHTVSGKAGELRVRGSTPDQTLILFNNIPIYHKGHYFGTISPFSVDIVDKVKIHRSGYDASLGGRVGGAIEVKTSEEFLDSTYYGVNTNSYYMGGYVKTPLIKKKLDFSISARTSHPGNYRSPKEAAYDNLVVDATNYDFYRADSNSTLHPIEYSFYDLNGAFNIKTSKRSSAHLNFISINNFNNISFESSFDPDSLRKQNQRAVLLNQGADIGFKKEWHNWSSEVSLTSSFYEYAFNEMTDTITSSVKRFNEQKVTNEINDLQLSLSATYKFPNRSGTNISFGYDAKSTKIRVLKVSDTTGINRTGRGGFRKNKGKVIPNQTSSGLLHSFYTSFYIPNLHKFSFNLGIRGNYLEMADVANIEPRAFLNYHANNNLTFKTSGGLYNQYLSRKFFFEYNEVDIDKLIWRFVKSKKDVISGRQALLGASYTKNRLVFDIDFYYKIVDNIQTTVPPRPPKKRGMKMMQRMEGGRPGPKQKPKQGSKQGPKQKRLKDDKLIGSLTASGMDVLIKYRLKHIDLWTNYTLSSASVFFSKLSKDPLPTNYDQRHNFNISASYNKNKLRASIGWLISSGIPDYPNNPFLVSGVNAEVLDKPDMFRSVKRLKPMHQLDASAAYEIYPKKWNGKITLGASILNLYNQRNKLEDVLVRPKGPRGELRPKRLNRYTIGFAPDIMLKIDWL